MTPDNPLPEKGKPVGAAGDAGDAVRSQANDPSLEALREILFSRYRQQIAELEAELDELERRVSDKDALIAMITPVLGDVIRRKIRDAREEMIEALYPIIGQTITRAVSEAVRELARNIDAQMRTSFNPRRMGRRLQAQISGVSGAEMVLRESLPFEVEEVFLIHWETGLLLWHLSRDPEAASDTDLISGMLTAIRDFAQNVFGRGEEGQLDEIQYGNRRILIETARYAYLAVVVDGVEPPGFQAAMRERVIDINLVHEETLQHYDGNPAPLASVEPSLRSLITVVELRSLTAAQKRAMGGILGFILLCVAAACAGGGWVWQSMH